jgi:hypothetical protein
MKTEEELERKDLEDQAKEVGKLSPAEYAKLRGIRPQLVYWHIRRGNIKKEWCVCGRRVIDVRLADEALSTHPQIIRAVGRLPEGGSTKRTHILREGT